MRLALDGQAPKGVQPKFCAAMFLGFPDSEIEEAVSMKLLLSDRREVVGEIKQLHGVIVSRVDLPAGVRPLKVLTPMLVRFADVDDIPQPSVSVDPVLYTEEGDVNEAIKGLMEAARQELERQHAAQG